MLCRQELLSEQGMPCAGSKQTFSKPFDFLGGSGPLSKFSFHCERKKFIVYNVRWTYTPEGLVSGAVLTRTNLLLEIAKVRRLRKSLQSRSNSEAVRLVIDERLAVGGGLQALRRLRRLGGLKDTFGRTRAKRA